MTGYAITILLSAILLFLIEPMISKALLPWFGGAAMVWSSAMLTFQVLLTGGYAYASWLAGRRRMRTQAGLHLTLLGLSVCLVIGWWAAQSSLLSMAPTFGLDGQQDPLLALFFVLITRIGLPFFLLASTSPLLQTWLQGAWPGRSPYRLYSLSNLGSILGLLVYPFLVEPALTLAWQGRLWVVGYLVFCGWVAWVALRASRQGSAQAVQNTAGEMEERAPGWRRQTLWLLLAACGSLMMLAVTNQLTQEVAAIPFLWVLPLSIYLLTFVLAFSDRRWYRRRFFVGLLGGATLFWLVLSFLPVAKFGLEIILYSVLLFAACMVCHGELYDLRPAATRLNRFYLLVSLGGALGGMFVNILAPLVFKGFWELIFGVVFTWILLVVLTREDLDLRSEYATALTSILAATLVSLHLVLTVTFSLNGNQYIRRNFYGLVSVREREVGPDLEPVAVLVDGTTVHGSQYQEPDLRDIPTTYYTRASGIGLAITSNPGYGRGMRVGLLGLGVGTLAAYGQPGDTYRFYEINPAIIDLANGEGGYFSFLADSPAKIEVVPGDARLSLEREDGNDFDILVLDTFSSDAIPVHLVTKEAFAIYLQDLAPDGLIAAHITNGRLDLRPLFWQLAQYYGLEFAVVESQAGVRDPAALPSTWVLLTRTPRLFEAPGLAEVIDRSVDFRTDARLWTDEYSNLMQLIK